jgi:diguanylate cyclase (GGDEF)-like protein/PAS domain S-box-containing protein
LNKSAELLTGWKRTDAIGNKFTQVFDITNAITGEKAKDHVEEVLTTNEICELANHTILTSKDGKQRHIADSAAPIKDRNGKTTGVVMVFRDVTEKKEMEEKLRDSESHYQMLFNSMLNGYSLHKMIYDENGHPCDYMFIDLNHAFEEMVGLKKFDCINKTVKELFPNTEEYWINTYDKVVQTGVPLKYVNYSSDLGKYFEVYAFRPIIGHFATTVIDITERKALKKLVFEEKEQLRITLDSIGDGVITTDVGKNVTILNKMAEIFTGWGTDETNGKKFNDVFNISSEIANKTIKNPVDEVLSSDEICELENHTILTSKDGTQRHIADSAAPIKDATGKTTGVVMVFRDVTEKKINMEKINFLSFHDNLTGLYNRNYFENELNRIDNEAILPVSIIMGDVNGLKLLNDVYGHKSGDELLKTIAIIINQHCEEKDIIARWGGDEFVVILPHTSDKQAEIICNNIKKSCEENDFKPIILSISLGASTKNDTSVDLNMVLKDAEDRMYTHKLVEGKSARSTIISSLQRTLF